MSNKDKSNIDNPAEGEITVAKKPFYTRTPVIITAAVLAVVIIVGILVGSAMAAEGLTLGKFMTDDIAREDFLAKLFGYQVRPLDFMKDDLDRYVTVDAEDYKGYDIKINVPEPTEDDLEFEIIKLLASKRKTDNVDRTYWLNRPIGAGDAVYVYYAGYEYDEDGNRVEIPNSSNYSYTVEKLKNSGGIMIGGGSMIPGFEYSLLGVVPNHYNTDFVRYTTGNVQEGDVVYATASYVKEDGLLYEGATIRIDLGDENVERLWGVNIYDYLKEEQIGMTNTSPITLTCEGSGDKITFTRITVNYITRCEDDSVLTIQARFPYDYSEESLRGKEVYFDIFFFGVVDYECPTYDDTFVLETLGVKEELIADYEGASAAEKYKNYRKDLLQKEYLDNVALESENVMWEHLKKTITVKEYPKREVNRVYDNYYYSLRASYIEANSDGAGYESLDEFACESLALDKGADWTGYIMQMTEDEIKEKLIFYSIMRAEGLAPTDEEFSRCYREELELDFEYYYGKGRDDYKSAEEYEVALAEYEKMMLDEVGVSYYNDIIYYAFATPAILDFANVINEAESK